MSTESALIVAQQQLIAKLLLTSEESTDWQAYCQDVLPRMDISESKFDLLVFNGKRNTTFFDLHFHLGGPSAGDASCYLSLLNRRVQITRMVISTTTNCFHLRISFGRWMVSIIETPGLLEIRTGEKTSTLKYPRPYDLGFREHV